MYDAPITKKIFEVLEFVVTQQSVGVSEIARAVGLSKGTTFGILAGLEKVDYVSKNRDTKKYTMGPRLFELSKFIDRRPDLFTTVKPFLNGLSKKLNRTVFLGFQDGDVVRIKEISETSRVVAMVSSMDTKLPLWPSAPGKILLSFMRDEEIEASIGNSLFSGGRVGTVRKADLQCELEEIRRLGYALDLTGEYRPGIWMVAMALDHNGRTHPPVVWVAGFKASLNEKRLNRIIGSLRDTISDIKAVLKPFSEEGCQDEREAEWFCSSISDRLCC